MTHVWGGIDWQGQKLATLKRNREASVLVLTKAGIQFASRDEGKWLIVQAGQQKVDFWPGTGKWVVRNSVPKRRNSGIKQLIEFVQKEQTPS